MQTLSLTQNSVPSQWQQLKVEIKTKLKQWPTQPLSLIITMNLIWIEHKVTQLDQAQTSISHIAHHFYLFQKNLKTIDTNEQLNTALETLLSSIS